MKKSRAYPYNFTFGDIMKSKRVCKFCEYGENVVECPIISEDERFMDWCNPSAFIFPYNHAESEDVLKHEIKDAIETKLRKVRELGEELSNSDDCGWIPIIKELDKLKDEILDLSYSLATGERP